MTLTLEDLERRVTALEVEAAATRRFEQHIFEALQRLDGDVVALSRRLDAMDAKFEARLRAVESAVAQLQRDMTRVGADLTALRRDLPAMLVEAVREGLKARP